MQELDEEFEGHREHRPKSLTKEQRSTLREKNWDKYTKAVDFTHIRGKELRKKLEEELKTINKKMKEDKKEKESISDSEESLMDKWDFGDTYKQLRDLYNSLDEVLILLTIGRQQLSESKEFVEEVEE